MKTLPKIQQFMAQNTAIFRRKAEELVKKGYVRLNGELAKPGERVVPQDDLVEYTLNGTTWSKVKYDGDMLVYYMVNKPVGYVCTTKDPHEVNKVVDIVPRGTIVHPVGRLDKNSEGLLILTNDGNLTYKLTHPKFNVEKEYYIEAAYENYGKKHEIDIRGLKNALLKGISLEDGYICADKVNKLSTMPNRKAISLNIGIHSGKKRILRRFFAKFGYAVTKLKRIRVGSLRLDVDVGKFRELDTDEVDKLMNVGEN